MRRENEATGRQPVDEERDGRIADMYRRGLEAAERSYDPDRHLIGQKSDAGSSATYRAAVSLPFARALLRREDSASAAEAAAIVTAVLDTQMADRKHPHCGNFLWLADDEEVVDLNAVQFVLTGLLPLLVEHGDQLPVELVDRCREAVRLGLDEEKRLEVAPTYTNIHLMSLFALIVGGQWLEDDQFRKLGKERWEKWVGFTVAAGTPHEYLSPGYSGIDLGALALIHQFAGEPMVRLQARLMYERLWLSLALRLHWPTRQLAGPHCRCYWGLMMSGRGSVKDALWRETGWEWLLEQGSEGEAGKPPSSLELALTEHWMPSFLSSLLERQEQAFPFEVRETANAEEEADLTTFLTSSYSLGTASRTYSIGTECFYIDHHANYLILYYARSAGGWGAVYSRYVVNDRHWGTYAAAPDRSKEANFYDQGNFAGAQLRNKAIGLYSLMREQEEVFSLKTVVAFQVGEDLEEVWVDDRRVDPGELPLALEAGNWLVVADGAAHVGVRPLEPSRLGGEAPILLERGPAGELWLTMYNYRGPAKRFWEYASLCGAFWRGNIRAGYVMEAAERSEYSSAEGFLEHLRRASIEDQVDEEFVRTIRYSSGGDDLELRYDLWRTEPGERRYGGTLYEPPNLDSPLAVQGNSGELVAGNARLVTDPRQAWLVAQELDPVERVWVAVNPEERPAPLRLETPCGTVTAEAWGPGKLEWHAAVGGEQVLIVDALAEPEGLQVPEGVEVRMRRL